VGEEIMTVSAEDQRAFAPNSSVGTAGSPAPKPEPVQPPAPKAPAQTPAPPARGRGRLPARLATRARTVGQRFQEATTESALSDFYGQLVVAEAEAGAVRFLLRNPQRALAAAVATLRLPVLQARLGDTPAARIIRWTLDRHVLPGVPVGITGVGVLEIPERAEDYVVGSSKQTLRRKVRAAEKAGVTFRPVDDLAERRSLIEQARQAEIDHPDETYRSAAPNVDVLLDYDLWLLAVSRDGEPLLLSVTPTDGEWALLRWFRTLGQGDEYSNSRYLMSKALVEALSARGVRYLVDTYPPRRLPNGLRHFQRMVGFRTVRARVARPQR
jgi:hypothetical protein